MEKTCICPIEIALGLALMGKKKLVGTVGLLGEKGAKGNQQVRKFLHAAQSEGAEYKQALGEQFRDSAKKALTECGFVTADDVAKVQDEITELKTMLKPACSANT